MGTESLISRFVKVLNGEGDELRSGDTPSESDVICLRHMQDITKGQKKCEREERAFLFEG